MNYDDLTPSAVQGDLQTSWLGRAYHYVERIDSTNDRLKAWAADATHPTGTVMLAEYQTAGRGRLDRRWEAPPGAALLFSVLLRPGWPAERGAWLTMLAGLAVAEAIEAVAGLPAPLKWPNDIVLPHADGWSKAGGILLDAVLDGDGRLAHAVIGIGLNVNVPIAALPETAAMSGALPAASLLVAAGRPVPRRTLLVALLERLEAHYAAADAGHSPHVSWNARLITLGQMVRVSAAGSAAPLSGVAEGSDEWGCLLVRDAAGTLHTVAAGDVTLRSGD